MLGHLLVLPLLSTLVNGFWLGSGTCPPSGYDSMRNFEALDFFSGTWYSVKQTEVPYQPARQLFCVAADYTVEKTWFCQLFGCDNKQVAVYNRAKEGVNGPTIDINFTGYIPNPADPSKVFVGLPIGSFIASFFPGNYWVVAGGKYSDLKRRSTSGREETDRVYDWAVITAGAPKTESSPGRCLPDFGFWLFARDPLPDDAIISKIEKVAYNLGLDTTKLIKVDHQGCTY